MCATSRFLSVLLIAVFVFAAGGQVNLATASSGGSRDCPCDADLTGGNPSKYCNADEEGTPCTCREDCPDGQECVRCYSGPDGEVNLDDIVVSINLAGTGHLCGDANPDVNCDGVVDFNDTSAVICAYQSRPDCCNQPVGACCTEEGPCIETDQIMCEMALTSLGEGVYQGDGTSCSPDPCDCDMDGIPGGCEVSCDLPGCDVEGCGLSEDCNGNLQPDECEVGGCCLEGEGGEQGCSMTTKTLCEEAGGTWRGPCATCPDQNVGLIREGDGSVFVHWVGPPVACPPQGKAVRPGRRDCTGGPFVDVWISTEKDPGDPVMCYNFGASLADPIPANFFGENSLEFTGAVCLKSLPLGIPEYGNADTLVERDEDPFDRCEVIFDTPSTVNVDVIALSLEDVEPITVTYSGGEDPEQWDVFVDLSPEGQPLVPQSTLTATRKHCNGGTYTSVLFVQPRFTFTKVGNPDQVKVLDTYEAETDPIELDQPQPLWWVVDLDPDVGLQGDPCTDFHPALIEVIQTTDCDCDESGVRDICELESGAASDCNGNGIPDSCDIASGTSLDVNEDGVPDECLPTPPLPENSLQIACGIDSQCPFESRCVRGVCYAPKHRYISIARNPLQVPGTARRISLQGGCAGPWWVGQPYQDVGLDLANVVQDPVYAGVAPFNGEWPNVLHVTGCEIATGQTYTVQAIMVGSEITDEGNYSDATELHTPELWGDVVSTCMNYNCQPPQGEVNIDDILAGIAAFQSLNNNPLTWFDIAPALDYGVPNQMVDIDDILANIQGFQSKSYPGLGPLNCP